MSRLNRVTTIEFPVFSNYIVHVEVTKDIKKAMQKYPSTQPVCNCDGSKMEGDNDAVTVHVSNENFSFIFLHPNCSVGTIAHECWHAVKGMMEYMGVELDSETVAYHLGYLVDKVFKFMKRR